MEIDQWTGIKLKEAAYKCANSLKNLGVELGQLNRQFEKPKSKYHK
jgi:hypothetical protein